MSGGSDMHWLDNAALAREVAREAVALRPVLAQWAGRVAVQVGVPAVVLVPRERYGRTVLIDAESAQAGMVRACSGALPLAARSVQLAVLVHVLEAVSQPDAAIRETARILHGEGRLVVVGFRFHAPAAAGRVAARLQGRPARTVGPLRLHRMVAAAGLVWERAVPIGGRPSGALAAMLPGVFSASYAGIAVKREPGMTVLRPNWRRARERRGAVITGTGRAG